MSAHNSHDTSLMRSAAVRVRCHALAAKGLHALRQPRPLHSDGTRRCLRSLATATRAHCRQIRFGDDGTLKTPWGKGVWKVVTGKENMIAATFIGRAHILQFTWKDGRGQFISSRCEDSDVVLGRALPS